MTVDHRTRHPDSQFREIRQMFNEISQVIFEEEIRVFQNLHRRIDGREWFTSERVQTV